MVLKKNYWEKIRDNDSNISYFNPKSKREIQITKTDYGNRGTFGRKRNPKWAVFKFKNNKPVSILKNGTKERALKSAKSYMKRK